MKKLLLIILFVAFALCVSARQYADSAIYQGLCLKLDVGMPVFELVRSSGKVQSYEAAINLRLAQRFYPTVEGGYAMANAVRPAGHHNGQGGFARLGADVAVIKKGVSPNNLLIGLRCGGAYQHYDLAGATITLEDQSEVQMDFYDQNRFDCWGEILAGCQVQVYKSFYMGWAVRMKILFTRKTPESGILPQYIPGFGYRKDSNWGFNYYLAYKF